MHVNLFLDFGGDEPPSARFAVSAMDEHCGRNHKCVIED